MSNRYISSGPVFGNSPYRTSLFRDYSCRLGHFGRVASCLLLLTTLCRRQSRRAGPARRNLHDSRGRHQARHVRTGGRRDARPRSRYRRRDARVDVARRGDAEDRLSSARRRGELVPVVEHAAHPDLQLLSSVKIGGRRSRCGPTSPRPPTRRRTSSARRSSPATPATRTLDVSGKIVVATLAARRPRPHPVHHQHLRGELHPRRDHPDGRPARPARRGRRHPRGRLDRGAGLRGYRRSPDARHLRRGRRRAPFTRNPGGAGQGMARCRRAAAPSRCCWPTAPRLPSCEPTASRPRFCSAAKASRPRR